MWIGSAFLLLLQGADAPGLILDARDEDRRVVQGVPSPNFVLRGDQSLHPRLGLSFRAEWSGFLKVLQAGKYTLSGEAKILIEGSEVGGRAIDLAPGLHALRVVLAGRTARLQLAWESDRFAREPIPPWAFVRRASPPEADLLAERGRELAGELGCVNCHRAASTGILSRKGPILTDVGARTNGRWLVKWLAGPRAFRANTPMPVLLDRDEARHAAAFLGGGAPKHPAAEDRSVQKGRAMFSSFGCAQCHGALEGLGSKYDTGSLVRYLLDPLKVDPGGRMPSMLLGERDALPLADFLVQSRNPAFEEEVAPGDAERGRALVMARGCLACHELQGTENILVVPDLAQLAPDRGCLAEQPRAGVPRYALDEPSRRALREFVGSGPDRSDAPTHAFYQAVRSYRCTVCHSLNESVPKGLEAYPPPLTDAGQKLRPEWMRAVLVEGKRIRPWMGVRMPHFGGDVAARLIEGFSAASGTGAAEPPRVPAPADIREGIRLVGKDAGGLSCINCHDFKGYVSLGTRGPDMVEMRDRLREEWFKRWMREPLRIQPGTSMPNFFASMAPAEVERKSDLLWSCLSAGRDMPLPGGLEESRNVIVVRDVPVVIRTFMPDSSPASIAVGLPGGVSYCFDADIGSIRYAWYGDFLEMTPPWSGRGGQPAIVLGRRFGDFPGVPRKLDYRFKGYRLVRGLPEFQYTVGGVEASQRISVLSEGRGLLVEVTEGGAVTGPSLMIEIERRDR